MVWYKNRFEYLRKENLHPQNEFDGFLSELSWNLYFLKTLQTLWDKDLKNLSPFFNIK